MSRESHFVSAGPFGLREGLDQGSASIVEIILEPAPTVVTPELIGRLDQSEREIGLRTLQRKLKEYGEIGARDEDEEDEG